MPGFFKASGSQQNKWSLCFGRSLHVVAICTGFKVQRARLEGEVKFSKFDTVLAGRGEQNRHRNGKAAIGFSRVPVSAEGSGLST